MAQSIKSGLQLNQTFDFGSITLSEDDIINFAKQFDPLPFHTDKKIAEQSIFKGLVASGPHIFNVFYNKQWVPMVGNSVLCGLELNNWKFIKPVYAGQPTRCQVTIIQLRPNEEKGHVVITWRYEFFNPKNEMVQTVDVTVMHKL